MATTATGRVRAPELRGAGGWINTDRPLRLADLRGRAVLLDFWTFCCINCLRVIEELRPLEERFGDRLVVIGVHSPKFPHESDHAAVERAVRRHRIEHPVLDDPEMETWQQYGVRAWPTLVVIDPQGYVVATASGEGNGPALAELIEGILASSAGPVTAGTPPDPRNFVARVALPPAAPPALPTVPLPALLRQAEPTGELAYPGKVASDGAGRLAVADTGHDRVLICALDGQVLATFGGFSQPQGVRFDGDRLLVCNTVAGELVAVGIHDGARRTLAAGMHSPWDVVRLPDGDLAVAEAGQHRLLSVPAEGGDPSVLAGTRAEGLRDGPALQAHLAQPSGLTLLADGAIAFADSEVSALRVLRNGKVETLVGQGLFEWGTDDGDRDTARLQHPLGVAALPEGAIAVADTFNSLLRVWRDGQLTTLALDSQLDEPGGLDVLPDGRLVVADTSGHRILAIDIATGAAQEIPVGEPAAPALTGSAGSPLELEATVDLDGEALDNSQGQPVRVKVSADPEWLLGSGPRAWALDGLPARVTLALGRRGEGEITLDVIASTCHDDVCTIRRATRRHHLTVD